MDDHAEEILHPEPNEYLDSPLGEFGLEDFEPSMAIIGFCSDESESEGSDVDLEDNTFLPGCKGKSVEVSDAELEQNTVVPDYKGKSVSSLPNLHPDLDDEKIKDNFLSLLGVGSCIDSFASAYQIYVAYGRFCGFGVRKCNQKYAGNSGVVKWKEFVCSCYGTSDKKRSRSRVADYKKTILRTGCKAKIRVNMKDGGGFTITRFEDEHNHELVPRGQSYMFRSSRQLSTVHKGIVESMDTFGFGVNVSCGYLEKECGGPQNLGFTRQDAYDHLKLVKRDSKVEDGDANNLMHYLIAKAYEEPYFFWKLQLDEDGRIMNFFFRDSRCAHDYKVFGDVMTVDTTYRCNRYNLICAPFVGINHHSMNVMFGMAFLSDETSTTFEWLFSMFLESMGGVEPKLVFTDQSVPMMNAIDKVFPHSKHRLCQWHINKNAPSHFGSLNSDKSFKKMWHRCMNGVESESEFEELWSSMIVIFKLSSNVWFRNMYKLRHRWASVFCQEVFSAGLHATSRSEATNRVLKLMKKAKSTLLEFVRHYERVVERWRRNEIERDTVGLWKHGQIVDGNPLLVHAASTYTRTVYKAFEYEFLRSFSVVLVDDRRDAGDGNVEFSATTAAGSRPRKVLYNVNTDVVKCSCRKLETDGIFCRHILKVYSVMNVFSIPTTQILKRWSKRARDGYVGCRNADEGRPSAPYMSFVNDVIRLVYEVTAAAMDSAEARTLIRDRVESLRGDVMTLLGKPDEDPKRRIPRAEFGSGPHWSVYHDPMVIKEKGWTHARNSGHWDEKNKKACMRPYTTLCGYANHVTYAAHKLLGPKKQKLNGKKESNSTKNSVNPTDGPAQTYPTCTGCPSATPKTEPYI